MSSVSNSTQSAKILQFIIEYIIDSTALDDVTIDENSNFVNEHLLDSFATLSMIMTLESEFSVKLTSAELADENMRIVGKLAQLIANKAT